jgi:hypothetical protein
MTNRIANRTAAAALALALAMLLAVPAQAYTFKFKNGMAPSNGKPVKVQYTLNKVMTQDDIFVGALAPGQSDTRDHGGWESGLCVDRLKFWVEQNLPGCEKQGIARQFFYKEGLWCGDKTFVIQREGCSLKLEVK